MTDLVPHLGGPAGHSTRCVYAPTPTDQDCGAPASLHLWIIGNGCEVELRSCSAHAGIARATGTVKAEHPFAPGYCSHPDSEWLTDGSQCVVLVTDVSAS